MSDVVTGYSDEVDDLREKMKENERAVHSLATSLQSVNTYFPVSLTSLPPPFSLSLSLQLPEKRQVLQDYQ